MILDSYLACLYGDIDPLLRRDVFDDVLVVSLDVNKFSHIMRCKNQHVTTVITKGSWRDSDLNVTIL